MNISRKDYMKQIEEVEKEWSTMNLKNKKKKILTHLDNLLENSQNHETDKLNLIEAYRIILTEGFPEEDQIKVVESVHKAAIANCLDDIERICGES